MGAGHHATVNYYVGHGVMGMPDLSTQPASARYNQGSPAEVIDERPASGRSRIEMTRV